MQSGKEGLWESLCGDVQAVCDLNQGRDPFQIPESKSGADLNVCFHFYYYPSLKTFIRVRRTRILSRQIQISL